MKFTIKSIIPRGDVKNSTSTVQKFSSTNMGVSQKIYQSEEAGDYVEMTYKGITVCVRENYPYYNLQNDKIYYSKEEEAEELYELSKAMTKSSVMELDI